MPTIFTENNLGELLLLQLFDTEGVCVCVCGQGGGGGGGVGGIGPPPRKVSHPWFIIGSVNHNDVESLFFPF